MIVVQHNKWWLSGGVMCALGLLTRKRRCCLNALLAILFVIAASVVTGDAVGQNSLGAGFWGGADGGSNPLQGYDYPWYDSANDTFKPLEFPDEAPSRTTQRSTVPIDNTVPKNQPQTAAKNTPAVTPSNSWLNGEVISQGFALIGLLVIFAVIGFLLYNFLKLESGTDDSAVERKRKLLSESIEQLPFELQTGNGDFRSIAGDAYAAGDLRRAMIYLYSHVLVTLDQSELILLRKGKTNRQYLKEVLTYPDVSGYFKNVMHPFESVFFGDHDVDRARFEDCWHKLDSFHVSVEQKTGGAV